MLYADSLVLYALYRYADVEDFEISSIPVRNCDFREFLQEVKTATTKTDDTWRAYDTLNNVHFLDLSSCGTGGEVVEEMKDHETQTKADALRPAIVSFAAADEYVAWLNAKHNRDSGTSSQAFRLPSEAEYLTCFAEDYRDFYRCAARGNNDCKALVNVDRTRGSGEGKLSEEGKKLSEASTAVPPEEEDEPRLSEFCLQRPQQFKAEDSCVARQETITFEKREAVSRDLRTALLQTLTVVGESDDATDTGVFDLVGNGWEWTSLRQHILFPQHRRTLCKPDVKEVKAVWEGEGS